MQSFHVFFLWNQRMPLSQHTDVVTNQEAQPGFSVQSFLLGFLYLGMVDWIIGFMTELSLSSPSSLEVELISPGLKLQPSSLMVIPAWLAGILQLEAHCESPH